MTRYHVEVVDESKLVVVVEGPPDSETMDRKVLQQWLTERALRLADAGVACFETEMGYTEFWEAEPGENPGDTASLRLGA